MGGSKDLLLTNGIRLSAGRSPLFRCVKQHMQQHKNEQSKHIRTPARVAMIAKIHHLVPSVHVEWSAWASRMSNWNVLHTCANGLCHNFIWPLQQQTMSDKHSNTALPLPSHSLPVFIHFSKLTITIQQMDNNVNLIQSKPFGTLYTFRVAFAGTAGIAVICNSAASDGENIP